MAGKTNSPIMLNVQSLCNRAMKKIPSNTCFNIQKILQWKKNSAMCFAVFFSCNIQLHLFFSPEYFPFNVRSHTQGKSNCKIAFSLERLLFYIFSQTTVGVLEWQKTGSECCSRLLRFCQYKWSQLFLLLKCLWTRIDNRVFVQNCILKQMFWWG